jgi:hypothetical protein
MAEIDRNVSVDHLRTIIGVVICSIGVIVATPIVRWLLGGTDDTQETWLPTALAYYVFTVPGEFIMSLLASLLAFIGTRSLIRRADPAVMMYAVGTVYVCFVAALLMIIYGSGRASTDLLLTFTQLLGTLAGLAAGYTTRNS